MKSIVESTALDMIKQDGLINLSRSELCKRAGIPDGSFIHIMGITFNEFVNKLRKTHSVDTNNAVVRARTNPELRKQFILLTAVEEAREVGYNKMTRDGIAERAGVSVGLVSAYFNTMTQLRRDVMRYAVKQGLADIVAQGLISRDQHARKAPNDLKKKAAEYIATI